MKTFVCIDIGGTEIKYGIVDKDANIVEKSRMATEARQGGGHILNKVYQIIDGYKDDYDVEAVCISTAGMVNAEDGSIFHASDTIPNYKGLSYRRAIQERYGLPCAVENDVKCAGLAEYISGASRGSESSLMLTIGTGVGGCAIIEDKIHRGFCYAACEVGYIKLPGGEFQTIASAAAMVKRVRELKNDDSWNGIRVFEAAKAGDEDCILAIDEMLDNLAQGIANICYVLNPEVVVLGGGIMSQKEYLRVRIELALSKYLVPVIYENTRLEFAKHQNDAGMLGAFYNYRRSIGA